MVAFLSHLFSIILIKFKKHLFSVLVFSLPDPWVHKTPTYFAVKAYTCVFVYQVFSYTANKEIRTDDLCLDVSKLNGPVTMLKCHHLKGNQLWEYDPVKLTLQHVNSNQCLDKATDEDSQVPSIRDCNGSRSQQWLLRNVTLPEIF